MLNNANGKNDVNKIKAVIYGQDYQIKGKASLDHLRLVALLVDHKMKEIGEVNPRLDLNRVAVLAAVNVADEYLRLRQEYDELLKILEQAQQMEG
ncbi:cell division protein ZapA [Tumebacillus sp. DT12]|uniref:Cell division protein ZapA n=1 Tax=Tumebacillus lacus TaxID=2995335 RepID=A0ABT3X1H4_9BACL|nr:cell division protein ZapA [Tumebacillus lacus]MCX7570750.1 cell division protein ZapA [Tumebacillus lacus]